MIRRTAGILLLLGAPVLYARFLNGGDFAGKDEWFLAAALTASSLSSFGMLTLCLGRGRGSLQRWVFGMILGEALSVVLVLLSILMIDGNLKNEFGWGADALAVLYGIFLIPVVAAAAVAHVVLFRPWKKARGVQ